MTDYKESIQLPSDDEQHDAYKDYVYAINAKDILAQYFEAGYRLGYLKAKQEDT